MSRNFYVTTAISYPNGAPHLGHVYELITTDVFARYHRLDGAQVHFVTGTDDHGQKMFQTARERGQSAQALADELTPAFRQLGETFACTNDDFIRTSEPRHHEAVQALWRKLEDRGDIYKGQYEGWYSVRDEAFYTASEITRDTQGTRLSPQGTPVEWVHEESYFFRLSVYQDRLLKFYADTPSFIAPESARNEVLSFVQKGLKDLSISRTSFDWGVRVPGDSNHIVYVWLDALTNYLTAIGYPDMSVPLWQNWPATLHIIGKDITRFHAIYWPAFLMSAGLECPRHIFAHGFLTTHDGSKMSKSEGNTFSPFDLAKEFGSDALRYFLVREIPFGRDGTLSPQVISARVNADLANDIGNLAQRCLSMVAKELGGILSEPPAQYPESDVEILQLFSDMQTRAHAAMRAFAPHIYTAEISAAVTAANRYFATAAPWTLTTTDPHRMGQILSVATECIRQAAILLQPVTPKGAAILLDNLAIDEAHRNFSYLSKPFSTGPALPLPKIAFPRIVTL